MADKYEISIISSRKADYHLVDVSTGIIITPLLKHLWGSKKECFYKNLWPGEFVLKGKNREINFNTINLDIIQKNGFGIKKIKKHFSLATGNLRRTPSVLDKVFSKIGWKMTMIKADKLLVVCEYLKKIASEHLNREAEVVPIGVPNMDVFKGNKITLKKPAVILIQNHQIKNKSQALIDFLPVIKKLPEINFYISKGLPENRSNIFAQAVYSTYAKIKNVNFVDINPKNRNAYLEEADVYVLVTGLDCTPATILEAGMSKKPVLASAIGGVPEMIINGKTGYSISNNNLKEWEEKILYLINNRTIRETMGKANFEFVKEKYNLEKVANEIYSYLGN